jgi:2-dehydro-3-deoxygalactonokinase
MPAEAPALLAVDWGTTQLRGALLDANGRVIDRRAAPRGLLQLPADGWAAAFDAAFGDWLGRWPDLPGLMCGMVGSRQGWVEAPYLRCPAGLAKLAAGLCWIRPGRLAVVPGLCGEAGDVPDVMRGEETQVVGALALLGLADATLVLPGTHSKWVQVSEGRITAFQTHMSGECYALFRQHSILARSLPAPGGPAAADDDAVDEAFDRGVARAADAGGLLHHLFGVRTLQLFDRLGACELAGYLSGLVIGEELRAVAPSPQRALVIVGGDALAQRYRRALQARGVTARCVGDEAGWRGLFELWRRVVPP